MLMVSQFIAQRLPNIKKYVLLGDYRPLHPLGERGI
jgi:hypothetical protein